MSRLGRVAKQLQMVKNWPMAKLLEQRKQLAAYAMAATYSTWVTDQTLDDTFEIARVISEEIFLRNYQDALAEEAAREAMAEPEPEPDPEEPPASSIAEVLDGMMKCAHSVDNVAPTCVPYSRRLVRLNAARRRCTLERSLRGAPSAEAKAEYAQRIDEALFRRLSRPPVNVRLVPESELRLANGPTQTIDASTPEGMKKVRELMTNPLTNGESMNYEVRATREDIEAIQRMAMLGKL